MYRNVLSVIAACVLLQFVRGAPQESRDKPVEILNQQYTIDPNGESYSYSFETANGIKEKEDGTLKDVPNENNTGREPAIVVSGSYSYIYNGTTYSVSYTADENGFRPVSQHIAPEITRALASNPVDSASPSASELHPISVASRPAKVEPEKEKEAENSVTEESKVETTKEEPTKEEPVKEESITEEPVKEVVTTTSE